jgi:hypothetical protein
VAPEAQIDVVELQCLLQEIDPGILLVEPRILRRIIKRHHHLTGFARQVPHRKSLVLNRDLVLAYARRWELGLDGLHSLPENLTLLARPDSDRLASLKRGDALVKYWRLAFHAAIHRRLEEAVRQGKLTPQIVAQRLGALGETEFEEIRQVLCQEGYLFPADDNVRVFIEFSAVYWEFRYFANHFLESYFPGLPDADHAGDILQQDLNPQELLDATRLAGAPEAPGPVQPRSNGSSRPAQEAPPPESRYFDSGRRAVLVRRASSARNRGNIVRAAILHARAAARAQGPQRDELDAAAGDDLDRLCARLQRALAFPKNDLLFWRQALGPLLQGAAQGLWPAEARLLYDLQKVCVDSERKVHTVDIIGWLTSFGRRRIVRLLPHHQEVMLLKHLRRATHRTGSAKVSEEQRQALSDLLQQSIDRAEMQVRQQIRPLMQETLRQAGMIPGNFLERIALEKLVEELLDLVVERGYLNMGDLRDAISRNNLKLSDLSSLDDLVRGDLLLRSSRHLRDTLDGVYHHGEFYLRWMQRLSSISFGTRLGRWLTLFVVLPFGGAYVILHGLHHIANMLTWFFLDRKLPPTSDVSIIVTGVFLFALINSERFRKQVVRTAGIIGRLIRALFVVLPALLVNLPLVQTLLASKAFQLCRDIVLKPLIATAVITPLFPLYGCSMRTSRLAAGIIFVSLSLLLNTFLGRHMEEALTDAAARIWRRFHLDVFPAVLRWFMDVFRQFTEGIERCLYTVDEWLRFRTGEGRLSLLLKGALGFIWFFVTYLVRVYVNLFIEPTFNPIKHIPVVTVAAKLMLPFIDVIIKTLAVPFQPLGQGIAYGIASINFFLIPGFFGFLVWELKENWRLYEANRSPVLTPVPVGHHGETMVRLLRPGFHSGTVPKTFARLRRALRKASAVDSWKVVYRQEETLHHVAGHLHKFAEREFLALLNGSQLRDALRLRLDKVSVSTNSIAFEFAGELPAPDFRDSELGLRNPKPEVPGTNSEPLIVVVAEKSGWLTASARIPDWIEKLGREPAGIVRRAILGLYKFSGVDLLEEDLAALGHFELADRQIKIWAGNNSDRCVILELHEGTMQQVFPHTGSSKELPAALAASRLLFRNVPFHWLEWVETWEQFAAPALPQNMLESSTALNDTNSYFQGSGKS